MAGFSATPPEKPQKIYAFPAGRILEDCSKTEFFSHPENRQARTKDFLNKILSH